MDSRIGGNNREISKLYGKNMVKGNEEGIVIVIARNIVTKQSKEKDRRATCGVSR